MGCEVKSCGPALLPYTFFGFKGRTRNLLRCFPWWLKDFVELGLQWRLDRMARRVLRKEHFDLVFHRASIYDFVGARLAKMTTTPVVAHLDAPFAIERAFHGLGYFASLHKHCMRRLGQSVRLVLTVSAASKDYYVKLGIPEEKILIMPNGISSELLKMGIELAKARPPFSDPRVCTIGFVGSLSCWHRVDLLLEALRELGAPQDPRWQVKIVGFGEEYHRLRALAREYGLDKCIAWLGALPHEQAFREIAEFDIAILPHTLSTGAPLKLFEYAALARPTIAPDLPNLRALFSEEEMCFVEPENPQAIAKAIEDLVNDPERARRMGLKAQDRVVSEYTWEKILVRVLEEVLKCG
jgi:glycosyltransferase involved in cell wall biosynthesis